MKTKDQILLEQAYKAVCQPRFTLKQIYYLDEKGLWKTLAPYAVAVGMATNAFADNTPAKESKPYGFDQKAVYATSQDSYNKSVFVADSSTVIIKKATEIITTRLGDKIFNLTVCAMEGDEPGEKDDVATIRVYGEVAASSQEEANQIASNLVEKVLKSGKIDIKHIAPLKESQHPGM